MYLIRKRWTDIHDKPKHYGVIQRSIKNLEKKIRIKICNSDPLQTTLTSEYVFYNAMRDIAEKLHIKA